MGQAVDLSTLIPLKPERIPSPLDAVVHNAGDKLKGLMMTRIVGVCADKSDAQSLVSDLLDLARIIDPVLLAIGRYADSYIPGLDLTLFTDQLRSALEGNATYDICRCVEEYQEELYNEYHEARGSYYPRGLRHSEAAE